MQIMELTEHRESAIKSVPAKARAPHHILFVDDDITIRRLGAAVLVDSGYTVDAAADGAAAWLALRAESYDLLVTDHLMPNLTGMELVRKVRAARMALPVILVTGAPPTEELERYPGLKLSAMISKPFSNEDLLARVQEALSETGPHHTEAWFPFPSSDRRPTPPPRWGINE